MFLTVKDLSLQFSDAPTRTLESVSFDLDHGKTLGLVGESGSGKSMTAYSIMGLLNEKECHFPSGFITFKDQTLLDNGKVASKTVFQSIRGKDIGLIFQEPMTALNPLHTIEQQISEPLRLHKHLTPKQARAQVIDLLKLVGFKDGIERLDSYPHQLSGGQRQRVMIASSIACEPSLLIADEPTTALDVLLQAQILTLIKELQNRLKMSLLFISHDLSVVEKMCDEVLVLKQGKMIEKEKTSVIFHAPTQGYTKKLLEPTPVFKKPLINQPSALLEVKDLTVTLHGKKELFKKTFQKTLLHPTSFTLHKGETLGIVGESGSGKTTLSMALLQLLSAPLSSSGSALWQEEDSTQDLFCLKKESLRLFRKNFQVVFQDPFGSLNPRMTVFQLLQEGLMVHFPALTKSQHEEQIVQTLKKVGLDPSFKDRYPHAFSGGQRQRIAIARALILKPKVIVLDEPTSALDRTIQSEILDLISTLQQQEGLSYVLISHDLQVINSLCHRVLVLKNGSLIEEGPTEEILTNPKEPYTKELVRYSFDIL